MEALALSLVLALGNLRGAGALRSAGRLGSAGRRRGAGRLRKRWCWPAQTQAMLDGAVEAGALEEEESVPQATRTAPSAPQQQEQELFS